jgi:hypothetical protein
LEVDARGFVLIQDGDEKSPGDAAVFVFPWRINNKRRQLLSGALFALVTLHCLIR